MDFIIKIHALSIVFPGKNFIYRILRLENDLPTTKNDLPTA
jgi:hypothetical protein